MAQILIVDDSPTEIFAFKRMLEGDGHQTIVANNGKEGVERARSDQPDHPDEAGAGFQVTGYGSIALPMG